MDAIRPAAQAAWSSQSTGPTMARVLARHWRRIVAAGVAGAALGGAAAFVQPREHASRVDLQLADPRNVVFRETGSLPGDYDRYVDEMAEFVDDDRVIRPAAARLGASPDRVRRAVSALPLGKGIAIVARTADADDAPRWVDAVATAFDDARAAVNRDATQRASDALDTEIRSVEALVATLEAGRRDTAQASRYQNLVEELSTLRRRRNEVAVNGAAFGSGVTSQLVAGARVRDLAPSPLKLAGIGAAFAAALALLVLWLRAAVRRPIESASDARAAVAAPCLGELDASGPSQPFAALPAPAALTAGLGVRRAVDKGIVAVTSVGSATDDFARNLATIYADAGAPTLLIETRTSGVEEHATVGTGLSDLLGIEKLDPAECIVERVGGHANLSVLPAGREPLAADRTFAGSHRLARILAEAAETYDHVVVDVAPVGRDRAGQLVAAAAGRVVFAVGADTPARDAQRASDTLAALGVDAVGCVFVPARPSRW